MPTAITTITHQLGPLLLNAVDDLGNRWGVVDIEDGYSTPPVKQRSGKRPYGHGSFRARSFWDERRLTITGWAECASGFAAEVASDYLKSIFITGDQVTYTKKMRQGSRFINVELADAMRVRVESGACMLTYQIPLKATDPRYLDSVLQTVSAAVSAPSTSGLDWVTGGGLDWVTGGGLNWGTSTSTGLLSVTNNAGTADAYPLVSIAGSVINPSISDPVTGRMVSYNGQISTGQTLVIDMSPFTRSVTVNGVDRSAALSSAQWVTVPPGATRSLQYGGSGIGQATVTMRSAYL
jgi:hypothetical protein